MYQIGDKASWQSLNRAYTGEVVGFYGHFAVVKIDGSGKTMLLDNRQPTTKKNYYEQDNQTHPRHRR